MYTFSFIVGTIIPKSVRWIHSATKIQELKVQPLRARASGLGFKVSRLQEAEGSSKVIGPPGGANKQ